MRLPTIRGLCALVPLVCPTIASAAADVSYPANPALMDGAVYVSAQGVSRLDAKTLTPVWRALEGTDTLEPVVAPDVVLIAGPTGLYALDPATGAPRWQLRSPQRLFPPAVSAGVAYVGGVDGSLRALALTDGKVLWRQDYGGWLYTPVIIGERLIVGGRERLLRALDTRTGKLLWQKQLTQELVYRPVAVAGGRVAVTLFDGTVFMVDATDGRTRWQIQENTPNFPPAVSAEALYFGSFDGKLHARAVADGRLLWQQQLGGRLHLLPQLVNAAVLVANDQGKLAAYDAASGKELWAQFSPHELVASPVVLNGKVVAFSARGAPLSWPAPFLVRSKLARSTTQ
jgi:outer membrane protein assembly factor BamB